jgi:hypothetical protein
MAYRMQKQPRALTVSGIRKRSKSIRRRQAWIFQPNGPETTVIHKHVFYVISMRLACEQEALSRSLTDHIHHAHSSHVFVPIKSRHFGFICGPHNINLVPMLGRNRHCWHAFRPHTVALAFVAFVE